MDGNNLGLQIGLRRGSALRSWSRVADPDQRLPACRNISRPTEKKELIDGFGAPQGPETETLRRRKVPGAEPVYMVYDSRDRLVMTQDGVQRGTVWNFTKYDAFNRPVLTGKYSSTSDLTTQQAAIDNYYNTLASGTAWFETYVGSGGVVLGYDNKSFPQVSTQSQYYSATYYDGYDSFIAPSGYEYAYESLPGQETTSFPFVTGLATGSQIVNLTSGAWMRTVSYYDLKSRNIQTISDHHKTGTVRTSNVFDFAGRVMVTKRTYTVNSVTTSVKETFTYDHGSRVKTIKHSINGASDVTLVSNNYNELGQLVEKNLHSTDGTNYKQSIDYRYNIRGWLMSMNNSQLTVNSANNDDTNDLFGMEFGYNKSIGTGNSALYNGNISAIKWSQNLALSTAKDVGYNYSYDTLNRIKSASYLINAGSWANAPGAFNESGYSYDLNGNIKALTRKGTAGSSLDILAYDYGTSGNQLQNVGDTGDKTKGFIEPASATGNDYIYDANGNMTSDQNKGITAITYNYLNLPMQVNKGTTDYIVYSYDAGGRKLKQQVYGAHPKTSDYLGELFYENDTLKFVNHEEGRIVMTGASPEYQYNLKDHLGNVRLTFTSKTPVTTSYSTDFESASNSNFNNYNNTTFDLVDHTDASGTTYQKVQWLNGGANGRVGLAKSFAVMPGDEISISAYCKYMNLGTTTNTNALITSLAAAFGVSASSTGELGKLYTGLNNYSGLVSNGHPNDDGNAPKVFATVLFFDKDYNLLDAAWDQVTTTGAQTSATTKQPPHDLVSVTAKAPGAGYAYVFLSNEHPNFVDVYFDDATFSFTPSPVVQIDDYYPFGLTFNSYTRENSLSNQILYNGIERLSDFELGWYTAFYRFLDMTLSRWMQIDPMSDSFYGWSPYNSNFNNPILYSDPKGDCPTCPQGAEADNVYKPGAIVENNKGAWIFLGNGQWLTLNSTNNGYVYNASDMNSRQEIISNDGPLKTYVLSNEAQGIMVPLNSRNGVREYEKKYGTRSSFYQAGEMGAFGFSLAAGSARVSQNKIGANNKFSYMPRGVSGQVPKSFAENVVKAVGGEVQELRNGYKITIDNGNRPIVIRMMNSGSGGREEPYFRVSISGKGSFDLSGQISSNSHHNITENYVQDIKSIVNAIKQ